MDLVLNCSKQITSRFDGTIKALHYGTDDMAIVGKVRPTKTAEQRC